LSITLLDGVLSIDYGFTIDKLEPFSERLFRVKGSNTYYNFFINQQNEIEGLEILFNGRAIQYFKKKQ
jgi:hypothetical protein